MPLDRQIKIGGVSTPTFLYGTAWKEERTADCVKQALDVGFRAIDTANQRKHYFEAAVGDALKAAYDTGALKRSEIFLQTKFTHRAGQDDRLPYDPRAEIRTQVEQSFAKSLEHLRTEYVDSYVLHGPSQRLGLAEEDWDAWRAMEKLQQADKARLLGISNVTLEQLDELCEGATVQPSFVQNRCYASAEWDRGVREFCQRHEIRYQGFSLLTANTGLLRHTKFAELVKRYGCTPAQLIFCFALRIEMLPLTGTTSAEHLREDLCAYDLQIESEDMRLIEFIANE